MYLFFTFFITKEIKQMVSVYILMSNNNNKKTIKIATGDQVKEYDLEEYYTNLIEEVITLNNKIKNKIVVLEGVKNNLIDMVEDIRNIVNRRDAVLNQFIGVFAETTTTLDKLYAEKKEKEKGTKNNNKKSPQQ